MSRASGRIRKATGDPILVRAGNAMVPTPRALEIHAEVHDLVQRAHGVFAQVGAPDLATLDRIFTILGSDMLVASIGVGLLDRLADEAPRVRLRFLPEPTPCATALPTWRSARSTPPHRRSASRPSVRMPRSLWSAPATRSPRVR